MSIRKRVCNHSAKTPTSARRFGSLVVKMAGLLAWLMVAACGDSSDSLGGSEDAAPDKTVPDSAMTDVSKTMDSTAVDVVNETSTDDAASSFDASNGDAPNGDAADGDAASHDAGTMGDRGDGEAAAVCQLVDASTPDPGAVAAGLALVTNRSCSLCHGAQFGGGVNVPPGAISKNLTPDPTGLGCRTDEQIVTLILDGVTPEGDTLCVMPKWRTMPLANKAPLSPAEAGQIVQYLRTLAPIHNVVRPTDCAAIGFPPPDAGTRDASDAAVE
jgi:mono/diheme cytochrome c family protein